MVSPIRSVRISRKRLSELVEEFVDMNTFLYFGEKTYTMPEKYYAKIFLKLDGPFRLWIL